MSLAMVRIVRKFASEVASHHKFARTKYSRRVHSKEMFSVDDNDKKRRVVSVLYLERFDIASSAQIFFVHDVDQSSSISAECVS